MNNAALTLRTNWFDYYNRHLNFLSKLNRSENSVTKTWFEINGKNEQSNLAKMLNVDINSRDLKRDVWSRFASTLDIVPSWLHHYYRLLFKYFFLTQIFMIWTFLFFIFMYFCYIFTFLCFLASCRIIKDVHILYALPYNSVNSR